jgi:hypothetical protein
MASNLFKVLPLGTRLADSRNADCTVVHRKRFSTAAKDFAFAKQATQNIKYVQIQRNTIGLRAEWKR